jgi:exosortase K
MIILSLTIAWGLKYHYSRSHADDLDWMLAPTSYLVHMLSGTSFEKVERTGYVDHDSGIIIAPSCSGINFMIIVFCLSIYIGLKKAVNIYSSFKWILLSFTISYSCTVIINTFRILLSIYSFKTGVLQVWFSWETIHLLEGVLVYFVFLLIYYSLLVRFTGADPDKYPTGFLKQIKEGLVPMIFYFSITLFIPIINHGGFPPNKGFIYYAAIVMTVCPAVLLFFFSIKAYCHNLSVRLK